MIRVVSPLLVAATVAAAAATAASSATPRPITELSTGKTFRLARGDTATLRLSNRWQWSDPRVSTKAVELTPVEYFVDPGFREWTIEARKRGRATIRSTGTPSCPTCAPATRSFHIELVVGPPAASR
jgi:predicted secreted protein